VFTGAPSTDFKAPRGIPDRYAYATGLRISAGRSPQGHRDRTASEGHPGRKQGKGRKGPLWFMLPGQSSSIYFGGIGSDTHPERAVSRVAIRPADYSPLSVDQDLAGR